MCNCYSSARAHTQALVRENYLRWIRTKPGMQKKWHSGPSLWNSHIYAKCSSLFKESQDTGARLGPLCHCFRNPDFVLNVCFENAEATASVSV
ncbi:hypothetical protein NDU88_001260 [Pleurodeles waltl]|uniref:Uncharacterized protein n=1 Tax=Pleurodeles waltl TaxID=8319 RepID=A0AAV7L8Z8_PLEWA|nr:hypothetical protein NDU88_001260 [Pleurodeles waltl]